MDLLGLKRSQSLLLSQRQFFETLTCLMPYWPTGSFCLPPMLHRKLGKSFDRYNSLNMRDADRLTGNFLGWTPLFLGPLWSMAMTETFSDVSQIMAWKYLEPRML
jgi:hypothetical protein